MVSQARMSTSSTLTVLAPCPRKYAASGSNSAIGVPVRAAIAYTANVVTVAPTASASAARGSRYRLMCTLSVSAGSVRSTSTKITKVSVSTRNWVSARSGAPWNAKIVPQP
jgi:hypothetical protein